MAIAISTLNLPFMSTCICLVCNVPIPSEEVELFQACMMTDSIIPNFCRACFFKKDVSRLVTWVFKGTVPKGHLNMWENKFWDKVVDSAKHTVPQIGELFSTAAVKWPANQYMKRIPIDFKLILVLKEDDKQNVPGLVHRATVRIKQVLADKDIYWDNQELGYEEKSVSTNL